MACPSPVVPPITTAILPLKSNKFWFISGASCHEFGVLPFNRKYSAASTPKTLPRKAFYLWAGPLLSRAIAHTEVKYH
jgi:hypothetical protein